VRALAFLPDGQGFLFGGATDGVKLFRPGHEPRDLSGGQVQDIAVSADGKRAVWCEVDRALINCWDLEMGRLVRQVGVRPRGWYRRLVFLPDGRRVLSGDNAGALQLWDLETGKELVPIERPAELSGVAIAPGGDRVVACGYDGRLWGWDVPSGRANQASTGSVGLLCVAFGPDGRGLFVGDLDGQLRVLDAKLGEVRLTFPHLFTQQVRAVALGADNQSVIAGGGPGLRAAKEPLKEGAIRVFDLQGKLRFLCQGHTAPVGALAVSADGRRLLSGSHAGDGPDDKSVRLWDARAGRQLRGYSTHRGDIHSVALSPDGRWGVSGGIDNRVFLYDLDSPSNEPLWSRTVSSHANGVAFTPDGRVISADRGGLIHVWSRQGELLYKWELPGAVHALALASDGKHIATANANGTVYVLRLPAPPARKKP
jgi:WD40 repeat protein